MPNITKQNQNRVVVFSEDTAPIISEILQKYNLEETNDEVLEKLNKEELLRGEIILNIVEDIVLGKTSKEKMVSSLQKELNISIQTAENLANDVKDKLLSMAREATPEEINLLEKPPEEELPSSPEEKIPYEPIPIREPAPEEFKKSPITKKLESPMAEKSLIDKKRKIQKPPQRTSDIYREPIE